MDDEQAAPPGAEVSNDDEWVMLSEAEEITGIRRDALYQRIKTNRIPEGNYRKLSDEPRAPFQLRRSYLPNLGTNTPRQYTRKVDPAARPAPTPTTPDISHHVAFCAGHCTAFLEIYAAGQDIGARQLIEAVTTVMYPKRGGK